MPLEDCLKARARALGFDLVGIAAAQRAATFEAFQRWLAAGHAGEMGYLTRHAAAHQDPSSILPTVKTVVMLGTNYHQPAACREANPGSAGQPVGRLSQYAHGADYHLVLKDRLHQLLAWVREQAPGCWGRGVVDTAPLLERDFARLAGLGWFGKNTMLLNKRWGSYFFLGALLLDIALVPDPPMQTAHCGTCTACLDACPTEAFPAPYVLDARRCISYLTIELRGPVPEELRSGMGNWIFGCDVCQDVCPWNRKVPAASEPAFAARRPAPDLEKLLDELLAMSDLDFAHRYAGTPLARPGLAAFTRNVLIALGNTGDESNLKSIERAAEHASPLVRETAAWALQSIRARMAARDASPALAG